MEKTWLDSQKIRHEVVFVDLNPKEEEAMAAKMGQMGVTVTEIEHENKMVEYVVGFDRNKLSNILGIQ